MKLTIVLLASVLASMACGRKHKNHHTPQLTVPGEIIDNSPEDGVVFKTVPAVACEFGGTKTLLGKDANKNGVLDEGDTDLSSVTVCNQGPTPETPNDDNAPNQPEDGADVPGDDEEEPVVVVPDVPGYPEIPTDGGEVAKKLTAIKLFTVTVTNPCGAEPGVQDDLVLTLKDGTAILLTFTGEYGIEFKYLAPGSYIDRFQCSFTVANDGTVDSI